MPAGYAHIMISDEALEQIKNERFMDPNLLGNLFEKSHFFQLGSVGPDYPYLDFLPPSQAQWADHMHYDHTGDIIKTMTGLALQTVEKGTDSDEFIIPFSWLMGYISHVTADLVVHPVVKAIVGPYKGHEAAHRHCEMVQDAFIYNKIRNGAEIEHSQLIRVVQNSSDPDDDDKIHPILRTFWKEALRINFLADYSVSEPKVDRWHDQFEDWLGLATDPPKFIGRILDRNHKFTYAKSTEIPPEERDKYVDNVPLPTGGHGEYERDVFRKAVRHVVEKWVSLSKGILKRDVSDFLISIQNCNLDEGTVGNQLVYWEAS